MSIQKEARRYIRLTQMIKVSESKLMEIANKAFKDIVEDKQSKSSNTFVYMTGFRMDSESIMTIEYKYGGGDIEMDNWFRYDITTNQRIL